MELLSAADGGRVAGIRFEVNDLVEVIGLGCFQSYRTTGYFPVLQIHFKVMHSIYQMRSDKIMVNAISYGLSHMFKLPEELHLTVRRFTKYGAS